MATVKRRIGTLQAALMIVVALSFDGISLIPTLNDVGILVAVFVFGVWFFFQGIALINPRRLITYLMSVGIEAVPILSWLPMITISVIATIVMSRTEDRLGIKLPLQPKAAIAGRAKPPPLSKGPPPIPRQTPPPIAGREIRPPPIPR